jgi:hypothetical protein
MVRSAAMNRQSTRQVRELAAAENSQWNMYARDGKTGMGIGVFSTATVPPLEVSANEVVP